jgi:CHAD domain-containing protein
VTKSAPRLGDVVASQAERVLKAHDALAADPESGVHDLRVALRRLRSTLTVFTDLLPSTTARVVDELHWAASELSLHRDLEILEEHAAELAGPDAQRLTDQIELHRLAAPGEVRDALSDPRFDRGMEVVRHLGEGAIEEPDAHRVRKLLAGELRRTRRRTRQVLDEPPESRDEKLHDVRKAVKRARYVAETFAASKEERAAAEALAQAQEVLGLWQDEVVMRHVLEGAVLTGPTHESTPADWVTMAKELRRLLRRIEPALSLRSTP